MRHRVFGVPLLTLAGLLCAVAVHAQEMPAVANRVITVKPNYLPPSEILDFLGVHLIGNRGAMEWGMGNDRHEVEIRPNAAANLLILSGSPADVDHIVALIREADIAPRQIEIEVKIVEVRTSKARDLGIDWEQALKSSHPRATWSYHEAANDISRGTLPVERVVQNTVQRDLGVSANLDLSQVLQILDQSGAGTVRTAPRILTLNNRRATILDGQRVTYITRYSSYTNLFVTDSMDAGLTLSVLPSLGESGYLTLNVNAELTRLAGAISDSPVKDGQMLENTIIAKDGEPVLLGGLTRNIEEKSHKRFPVLGNILPFLFSREVTKQEKMESFIVLTPRVVDFATAIDEKTKSKLEGN